MPRERTQLGPHTSHTAHGRQFHVLGKAADPNSLPRGWWGLLAPKTEKVRRKTQHGRTKSTLHWKHTTVHVWQVDTYFVCGGPK